MHSLFGARDPDAELRLARYDFDLQDVLISDDGQIRQALCVRTGLHENVTIPNEPDCRVADALPNGIENTDAQCLGRTHFDDHGAARMRMDQSG